MGLAEKQTPRSSGQVCAERALASKARPPATGEEVDSI